MRKGISFFFGFNDIAPEERVRLIAAAGFDAVITTADKRLNRYNSSLSKQVKLFKKYGLQPSSLHMSYTTSTLHYFWETGRKGDQQMRRLMHEVKLARRYGFSCVVVHLFGTYSVIGEQRLRRVLQVCAKCQVPLAIENIDCPTVFWETLQYIQHPYLRFCYDSGHNHVFDPDTDYLTRCGDKLIALHLHDNDGTSDQHTINRLGTIDWPEIARKLAGKNVVLDYEILLCRRPDGITPLALLQEVKRQADDLEAMIMRK